MKKCPYCLELVPCRRWIYSRELCHKCDKRVQTEETRKAKLKITLDAIKMKEELERPAREMEEFIDNVKKEELLIAENNQTLLFLKQHENDLMNDIV